MDLSERRDPPVLRHPWETARAAFLLDLVDDQLATAGLRVLDTGSGDAWLAQQLIARADDVHVTCWDLHYQDADIARLQTLRLTPTKTPPATSSKFDLALMLDVIEHVDDDAGFVHDVVSRVRPGGTVLVSVPAWPRLFSSHDRALHHMRRYTPDACREVLVGCGLEVVRSGGFFHGLLLPRAASVVREAVSSVVGGVDGEAGIGAWGGGRFVTRAVHEALRLEQRASAAFARRGVDVPGLSFFALCRVPA